jgi:hypothetical protein
VEYNEVGPDYFVTMDIPLVANSRANQMGFVARFE